MHLQRFLALTITALTAVAASNALAQTFTWDGGGGDDNFGTGANWASDSSPSVGSGVVLQFTGSARPTPNNNYTTGDNFGEWHLLSGAGGDFTISGNGFGLYSKVENDTGSGRAFTINTAGIYSRDGSIELNPVGGNLTIGGSIELDNNASLNVYDGSNSRTLTLNGALSNGNGSGGDGSLTLNQTATVILAADSDFGGATINSGTTLRIGAGGGTGTLGVGNTANSGSLIFNRTGSLSYGGIISGTGTLSKQASGTVTLVNNNTYTGTTTVSAGKLALDFNASGAANNIVSPSSALSLGGGTLQVIGNSASASSQTFASTTFTLGNSAISAAPASGANYPTVALGALTFQLGGTVRFDGPATINGGGNVAATTTITTTTAGNGGAAIPWGLLMGGAAAANYPAYACYATVGLYDWASTDTAAGGAGTSPYTIIGGSQVTGFYATTTPSSATSVGNWNMTANTSFASGAAERRASSLRFNTPTATTLTYVGGTLFTCGGILVTPNMGANNTTITGTGQWQIFRVTSPAGTQEGVIWQNNVSGYLNMLAPISNGRDAGDNNHIVKAGDGTAVFSGVNSYVGQTYVNGGNLMISANSGLGDQITGAAVNLNGGTLVGNATFTVDNFGANKRNISLLGNGGGLAATAGNTMTVSGVVSGATGTGSLTIGIPASSANGNTLGLLSGSGSGTANTTPVNATGTVVLSGGANTYTGGTVLSSGTLQFTSGSLGTGGVTLNGGTLQWAGSTTTDISSQRVSFLSNGGTLDVNGNTVALANSVGNGGSGTMTIKSTAANGVLNLQAANNYSGNTTVSSGTLKVNNTASSATGSGNVTVNSGATLGGAGSISGVVANSGSITPGNSVGTLTAGSLTMNSGSTYNMEFNSTPANDKIIASTSGGLVVNAGAFNLYQEGSATAWTTPGTYNLIQYSGSVSGSGTSGGNLDSTWTTSSASNPHIGNPQAGYLYAFDLSGGWLRVTISQGATVGSWSVDANGNWSDTANWAGGTVPGANTGPSGDSATFATTTTTAARTVTLDANQSVGAITMNQANSFTISGANTLTLDNKGAGAALQVTAGTANAISTTVSLTDNAAATVSSGKSLSVSGNIGNTSTSKTLAVNGAGTLALSGNNTYGPASAGTTGTTLSGGGTLQVGSASALGAGDLSVTASSTLQAGSNVSLANNIALGSATVTVDSTSPNDLALTGVVGGSSGALTKTGNGTLTLSGANSYYNNTTVSAGTLKLGAANSIPNGGSTTGWLILDGGASAAGTLDLNGYNQTVNALSGNSGTVLGQIVNNSGSGTSTLTVTGNTTTFAGLIKDNNTGSGQVALSLSGSAALTLSGANAYSGGTIVGTGTILRLGNAFAIGTGTLNINGGTLDSTVASLVNAGNNAQNWNADFAFTGTQNLDLGSGTATIVGATRTVTVSANTLTVGAVSDGGNNYGIIKAGGGTMTLSGNSTYTGGTTISAGTVKLTSNTGAGTGNITATGQLRLGNGVVVANGFTANQTFECLDVADASATATYTGTAINTGNGLRFQASGAGATLIFSNATVTINAGGKTFWPTRGNIVYAGNTVINNAGSAGGAVIGRSAGNPVSLTIKDTVTANHTTLSLGEGGGVNSSVSLTLQDSATVNCSTFNALAANMAGANIINLNGGTLAATSITKGSANAETLNWNGGTIKANASSATFFPALSGLTVNVGNGGAVVDTAGFNIGIDAALLANGSGGLTKNSAGTLTLGGASTYTGNTTISDGTLALGTSGSIAATPNITVADSATFDVSAVGGYTLGTGQTLKGNGTVNGAVTVNGTLAPGTSIGTLTNNSAPTLNGTLVAEINPTNSQTADKLVLTSGTLTYGGTLTVTNIGPSVANGTFTLFNAPAYAGAFTALNLPAGGVNHWKTNDLVVDGTITFTNIAPVAKNLTLGVALGGTVVLPVIGGKNSATDAEADSLSVTAVGTPSSGSASYSASNVTYTADGSGGTNTFTYTVTDAFGATDTKTVTVVVSSPVGFNMLSGPVNNGNGTFTLGYLGIPGLNYALDESPDLVAPYTWFPVLTNAASGTGSISYTVPLSYPSGSFRTRYVP